MTFSSPTKPTAIIHNNEIIIGTTAQSTSSQYSANESSSLLSLVSSSSNNQRNMISGSSNVNNEGGANHNYQEVVATSSSYGAEGDAAGAWIGRGVNDNDNRNKTSTMYHRAIDMDQIPVVEDELIDIPAGRRESFINVFMQSNGPPQIVLLIGLLALGFGSVIGVVPAVMTDRYARINHGYDSVRDCSDYPNMIDKPNECLQGSADAQNAVAIENLISNILTFLSSSLLGSISDMYGRKNILVVSMIVCTIRPLSLVLIQTYPMMSPFWYYAAGAVSGLFNWTAIALSSLSDVMPKKWRAPSFGLLMAGFAAGFAFSPQFAIVLGHYYVSILSLVVITIGLLITIVWLPETLSDEAAMKARRAHAEQMESFGTNTIQEKMLWTMYRPIWELSILNRNRLFRLLTSLAFFSSFVSAGDQTLLVYYIEERLGFQDSDIAKLFLIIGCLGIFIQGFVLKYMNEWFGERRLLMISFTIGTMHNALYGLASIKSVIFLAAAIGSFAMMAFPTISAIKANNVESSEQGRIQGALYSVSAIGSAIGPLIMRVMYHYTKDGQWMGPGSMFILAAGVNSIAVYCAYGLPMEANSEKRASNTIQSSIDDIQVEDSDTEANSISDGSSPLIERNRRRVD